eukprot:TRINITY_DN8697_c0_g1_i1.p1 TRINITY_DN8697_c0_g1~~TRINITY_DN8697_c0_g1_i1.p1  ORF type:complete len:369 (+),score=129.44 TRINITY_DN8697_c0_g1_i1:303-1409(+)
METLSDVINREPGGGFLGRLHKFLRDLQVQYYDSPVGCVRNVILKIFQKVCNHALSAEQFQQMINTLMVIVESDNEENAIIALQILREAWQKNIQIMDASVSERIERLLKQQLEKFREKCERTFGSDGTQPGGQAEGKMEKVRMKAASKDSFKIYNEVYILILMAMGVSQGRKAMPNMMEIMPIVVDNLSFMPDKFAQQKHKDKFIDFLNAQNKMYSIINWVLRSQTASELIQKCSERIANYSITYLKNCPPENSSIRKSFLQILRNMIVSFIDPYLNHLEVLLDYNALVGDNNERQDLRVEASTIILNIAQYTKEKLDNEQKEMMIRDILRMINDITITISIQGNAVLSLNKFIDTISKMPDCVSLG